MKKIILVIFIALLSFIPFSVSADEYKSLNFDEVLKEEEITHDFSNYKETDDQIVIYLFRGKGCAYCRKFLSFLNSIVDDYGKYFKVVSYEVWYDKDNAKLMDNVSKLLDKSADGVPYIIIGDKVFGGYSEAYDNEIKSAIKELYEKDNRYDVMTELSKNNSNNDNENKVSTNESALIIVVNLLFIAVSTVIIIIFNNKNKEEILEKLNEVNTMKKVKKTKGE